MSESAEPSEQIEQLRTRITEDPASVSVEELTELVVPADATERRRIATALDEKLVADPSIAPSVIEAVEPLLAHENGDVRTVATMIIEHLAGRYPERATPVVDDLSELAHDDYPFVRRHAVWSLAHISGDDPERVASVVPKLRLAPDEPAYHEHEHLITLLRNVAETNPDAIGSHAPALVELLENVDRLDDEQGRDGRPRGQKLSLNTDQFKESIDGPSVAAALVATIADVDPTALTPHADGLAGILETADRQSVRRDVAAAFAALAEHDPDAVEGAIPALANELESQDETVQTHVARALGFLAATAPGTVTEAVTPRIAHLETLLREGTPQSQAVAAGLLSYVAEEDPDAVEPVVDALIACLAVDEMVVRASAALALGYAGGADAEETLEELFEDDLEPELRETVTQSIDRIDSRR